METFDTPEWYIDTDGYYYLYNQDGTRYYSLPIPVNGVSTTQEQKEGRRASDPAANKRKPDLTKPGENSWGINSDNYVFSEDPDQTRFYKGKDGSPTWYRTNAEKYNTAANAGNVAANPATGNNAATASGNKKNNISNATELTYTIHLGKSSDGTWVADTPVLVEDPAPANAAAGTPNANPPAAAAPPASQNAPQNAPPASQNTSQNAPPAAPAAAAAAVENNNLRRRKRMTRRKERRRPSRKYRR